MKKQTTTVRGVVRQVRKVSMKRRTYKQRTLELETVKFALEQGYSHAAGNLFAKKHFNFVCLGAGSPAIEVNWFQGTEYPSIKVGNTSVHGNGADQRSLALLKKFLVKGEL